MTPGPVTGVHRPRPRGGLAGAALALVISGALLGLLIAAAVAQIAAAVEATGRPVADATVVACPPPGGTGGPCTVRIARDGHDADLLLTRAELQFPELGDRLDVAPAPDGTARPAGWRPWAAAGGLLVLLGGVGRAALHWARRALEAATPELPEGLAWARLIAEGGATTPYGAAGRGRARRGRYGDRGRRRAA